MNGQVSLKLRVDGFSPRVVRALRATRPPTEILRAMGSTFLSITQGNFNSVGASYRPSPWKAKRDGSASNLQKSTTMSKAFHLSVNSTAATVGNSVKYSRIHQLGGTIVPKNKKALKFQSGGQWYTVKKVVIPARPFFPVDASGHLTEKARVKIVAAAERVVRKAVEG